MTWSFAVGCAIGAVAAVALVLAVRLGRYLLAVYRVVASVDRRPPRQADDGAATPGELLSRDERKRESTGGKT